MCGPGYKRETHFGKLEKSYDVKDKEQSKLNYDFVKLCKKHKNIV